MASWKQILLSGTHVDVLAVTSSLSSPMNFPNIATISTERTPLVIDASGNVGLGDADYISSVTGFDIDALSTGTPIGSDLIAFSDQSDTNTDKKVTFDTALSGSNVDSMAFQNASTVNIDGGDIASGVTINKSPVVNFNSGDVQGSVTLTNLATGTGGLTIQAGAVEHSMLNSAVISAGTETTANLSGTDEFLVDITAGLRRMSYTTLSASLANTGFSDATGDVAGPGSSTDNAIARFDSTTGKIIQGSSVIINDTNDITGVNDLTVDGDLTVNGTTTTINTTNVNVEDQLILLNDSATAVARDGGIVVQQGTSGSGKGLIYDQTADKWGIQGTISATATAGTPDAYLVTVENGTSDPAAAPENGDTAGYGQLFVNTSTNKAFIYV